MPQRFIPAASSFCGRKIKLCVREEPFREHANKDTVQFRFCGGAASCGPSSPVMFLPNALQSAEI